MFSPTSPLCLLSVLPPGFPVQPPGAAEGMGAEHRPGRLRAQAAHSHLLRALRPECFSAFRALGNLKHNAVPTVFAFQGPPQVHGREGPQLEVGWALLSSAGSAGAESCQAPGSKAQGPRLDWALGNLQFKAA